MNIRFTLLILFGITPITASAQPIVNDSLLYHLTSRTIDGFQKLESKRLGILKYATIPAKIWDAQNEKPKTSPYFSAADSESIANQVRNPAVKRWDVETIMRKQNLKFVTKIGKRDCLVISLPIASSDGQIIVIYYQSLSKNSDSVFVTVWHKTKNSNWTKGEETMLWIAN